MVVYLSIRKVIQINMHVNVKIAGKSNTHTSSVMEIGIYIGKILIKCHHCRFPQQSRQTVM